MQNCSQKGVILNATCVALAEHLCGSVEGFVKQMNKRAADLGLENSNFVNTNGLPVAKHYSCAYDIGMISKELMSHEVALPWFISWQEDIKVGLPGKQTKFTLTNTNRLVRNYSGAIGVKTGFTQDAGYCLSGAAKRDGTTMIGVVLGCETSDIRFAEMSKLLDYGFANYETVVIAKQGEKIKKLGVEKGDKKFVWAVSREPIGVTVKKGEEKNISKKIIMDEQIKLPVKKGGKIGEIHVYEKEKKIGVCDLISDKKVEKASFMKLYIRMMKKLV
ncbi:MAG: D-alanyl-D-alanine carboxypeptidase [Clostridiales bacterium]|nr:D-alanyl-D-alanine carboxypeptidase [Clostridiales bacterium]